ncbi:MAG: hypothetical protein ABJF10_24920 [Chthoniobacter sp.]|uniref:hypothetical protein n=1 Tax=Chthoniobacter sp. TaxID=2510640 RepID=UPI0032A36E17
MNKPILSFVYLSALALACPVIGVIAAPSDAATATEAADRKFLANLENSGAPHATPAAPVPVRAEAASPRFRNETAPTSVRTDAAPAPVTKADAPRPKEKPVQAKVAVKKPTEGAKTDYRNRISQPAEVADVEGAPVAPGKKTTTTVTTVVQPLNGDRDGDHDPDRDRGEKKHFFHRLFAHVFNQQHPEDW